LLTFWYINHKKIKGKECTHVTTTFNRSQNVECLYIYFGGQPNMCMKLGPNSVIIFQKGPLDIKI